MIPPREEWHLDTRRLGRRVLVYDRLDSTSTLAAALAHDPANDGVAVLADEQSAGRGQYGRRWLCPPRCGVLLSLLLFPPVPLRRPALLTAWAAVAVCETIRQAAGLQAHIKWPNDVLIRGRKVCGILIEQGQGTVVGIGLNVNQPAAVFEQAGLTEAGSLAVFTGTSFDSYQLARRLLGQLDEEYDRLCAGDLATLETRWQRHLGLLGKLVVAECPDRVYQGRLCELAFDGLILEPPDGATIQLRPEMVRHLRPA
ncbi:MAG TPA: biotin--[acetyl-CoA-carboxylase] ligase [Gemmataceae bacterium]|nr:biotin--[acetyl-CoA-carboxylase] ligase [Gemmataceae bacterium]